MEPLDAWKLGGDPTRLFGGYMKMQWIWGGPKRAAAAMLLALGLGGLAVAGADHLLNPPATFKFASADEPASRNSFAPVVKKVLPSVVTVTSSRMVKTGFQGGEDGIPPMFRQFFGGDPENGGGQLRSPRQQREEGLGSGVIVSPNGYILTNNNVVDHATTCLLYTSPSPRDRTRSRMPSS